MARPTYPKWLNFVLFQAIWFAGILGQSSLEWLIALMIAIHLLLVADLKRELRIILPCAAIGVVADMILTLAGVLVFDPAPTLLPIPFWLVGIWFGFACTFRHSMSYLMERPLTMVAAAALAAPLSYLAGMRLGAVSFGSSELSTALLIGLLWVGLMPMFLWIYSALQQTSAETRPKPPASPPLRSTL